MPVSEHGEDVAGRNALGVEGNAAVLTYPKEERHKTSALVCNLPAISPWEAMKVYDQPWQCQCISSRKWQIKLGWNCTTKKRILTFP